jgi:hypothetical protein
MQVYRAFSLKTKLFQYPANDFKSFENLFLSKNDDDDDEAVERN